MLRNGVKLRNIALLRNKSTRLKLESAESAALRKLGARLDWLGRAAHARRREQQGAFE